MGIRHGRAGLIIAGCRRHWARSPTQPGRKPWIAIFGTLLVLGSCVLWFGKPGDAESFRWCCALL